MTPQKRILSVNDIRKSVTAGEKIADDTLLVKAFAPVIDKQFSTIDRTVRFTISTGDVDRDNDTIDPQGWELAQFEKSGVVLWDHTVSYTHLRAHET